MPKADERLRKQCLAVGRVSAAAAAASGESEEERAAKRRRLEAEGRARAAVRSAQKSSEQQAFDALPQPPCKRINPKVLPLQTARRLCAQRHRALRLSAHPLNARGEVARFNSNSFFNFKLFKVENSVILSKQYI
jgi:hypothetical protein